jgi:hypothetical protein
MVGSWPCKVLFEVHINGQHVSEPVREDKGKTTATEPKDGKDPKRARVVLSKGREVVGPGYSRVTSVAAKVTDKRGNLGNHSWVNRVSKIEKRYPDRVSRVTRVSKNSNMDWQVDWVSRVSQNSSMDWQADRLSRVTQVSPNSSPDRWTDWVSWVGDTEQKMGGSSRVADTESQVTQNSANTESRVMKNSANTENQVTQDLGGKNRKK